MDINTPIDAVITWVDGNDPAHRKKRLQYSESKIQHQDIDGETRFVSVGEIAWCIASINRFAPFIRKIYIVTDNQNPGICPENGSIVLSGKEEEYPLSDFISRNYAHPIPMEIIDHRVIFKGYEEYLPTFNSLSIETMLYRIPGLSDHFIYFNDDLALIRETTPEVFFADGKANAYGYWHKSWTARLLRTLRPSRHGHKEFTFRDSLLNGADAAGVKKNFFRLTHTPHAMDRRILENYFNMHPELIVRNLRHKFRDSEQFNPQAMFQNLAIASGQANVCPTTGLIFYMMPKDEPDYIANCIKRCESIPDATFLCVNSLDLASVEDRTMLLGWLASRLGIKEIYKV